MPPSEPSAEPVVNHVGQATTDLALARRFYVELLGFEERRQFVVPDAAAAPLLGVEPPLGLTVSYLHRGAFVLELMEFDRSGNPPWSKRVFNEPGLTHLSISVDDVSSVVDRIAEFGGLLVTVLPGAAIVRDPDGQLLELLPMAYRRRLDADDAGGAPA